MRMLMLPRYDELGASSRLRLLQYIPALQIAGIEVKAAPLLDDRYVRALYAGRISASSVLDGYWQRLKSLLQVGRYDVVWLEKELWPWLPSLCETAPLPRDVAVVADYDDAVFHRYDEHPNAFVRQVLGRKVDRVMRRADLVTAGNAYLAERADAAGARRIERLPTVVDLQRYPRSEKTRESTGPVVIGWIGSPSTAGYLKAITPALQALALRQPIRCVAIGARADQLEGTPFEAWTWREQDEVAMLQQFDIGAMPLPDASWERGKCGYKLIQYMACSLPVVASPVGVNREIVTQGINGLLASTTAEWVDALELLIADASLRRAMGAAGRRAVEDTYSLQAQAPRLVSLLRELVVGESR
ncbi:glycosyltransferase involved in cell wall biosynthesis [Lysobacter niastensis]|uniref:Glycosyltransferase involved in cell wall biosynthesis n=1 Tax=Lysobacter niastensis TaxID=380629 RepID=A0ABU1WE18_9GAMM|nr:glycosyltransferase family 4 protein [Lysobacter niastensis]MDR7135854.1 glycosyltransferase involved in cell wall biosynthesis [Lysobacter niastensis]